ncbi:HlyD family efflux transporter periplasmic adaptor subunit [Paenibacillus sp. NPDC057934]|uniref:HlyD family efflux transporter periplasmic adaptor subunit n=1 Tax=Paenibacillus sp. NPDC057934 TaxID=3346282 RepID=UPI0036DAD8E9
MKLKAGLSIGLAVILITGGILLTVKGKDAVTQAEHRKQGILEAEQTTVLYDKSPGAIVAVNAAVGDSVKQGQSLFTVQTADGAEADIVSPGEGQLNRLVVKPGDKLQPGMPVALLQKNTYYTDLYVQEEVIQKLKLNQNVTVHFRNLDEPVETEGVVASIATAPQFASLRMTREKGQADLSMFLVRISMDAKAELLPGMTAEVDLDELAN